MIIDVHAHFYPRPYLERLRESNRGDNTPWGRAASRVLGRNFPPRFYEVEPHLGDMDASGIDVEALSLTIPYPYFDDERQTVELTRLANDEFAELCARFPNRFKAFAALPLPYIDASLAELERAIDTLGLHGIGLAANVRGIQLDDDRFGGVFGEINRRSLAVFMHGMMAPGVEEIGPTHEISFGFLVDETLATIRLAFKGVFATNPNMAFIVPHMGQLLGSAWERITGGERRTSEAGSVPAEDMRHLYYDTVNRHRPGWVATIDTVGTEQIVYGSDYPFGEGNRITHTLQLMDSLDFTPQQREMTLHGIAEQILL